MARRFTVAEARAHLPNLLHAVEHGEQVEITRRGKPVAVVLSFPDFQRLEHGPGGFWNDFLAWRNSVRDDDLALPDDWAGSLRDRSPGRDVKL
jgi:prevent-host-death family protein